MVLCGLMVDASFAPSCRSYCEVNTFGLTFCANGLISVPAVHFDASCFDAPYFAGRYSGFGHRGLRPKWIVTQNGTDLYFSAKFLKLSMIIRVILTSFGQACLHGKGLFRDFRA
jgi:hypothetical protein